ncbi:serine hydrolase [Oryzicola mucosus]|uniref:Serine hydrolase n=1 Tax=Oryzicola mucosus TaxID=2767425 RepID=A0A8J6PL67_9HYPH|nr:serine hydrolase [Oryzicola mucosus]MBD0413452.1 serine hydrolase [Oryzicola mucosus]
MRLSSLKVLLSTVMLIALAPPGAFAQEMPITLGAAPSQDAMTLAENGVPKAVEALPDIVAKIIERSGVPGVAVAVVHDGKTVFSQGYGLREIGKPDPITPETVFQIASVSKPISATIAAIEITKGKAAWTDPVVKYLPDFKLSDPYVGSHATIGDFFAHHTGLPPAAGDDLEDLGFSRDEIIARLSQVPLDSFRASYHYANFGTTIAGEAIAAAAGKPWETLAEEALYQPLGMASTSSRYKDFMARDNRAVLHALQDGKFQPLYQREPDAQSPAGGVSSNVLDLAEWLKLLLAGGSHNGGQLISEDVLLPMMSPQAVSSPAHAFDARTGFYGYGLNVGVTAGGHVNVNHSGAFALGAGTTINVNPAAKVGIVVLTNGSPVGVAEGIAVEFMDIVQFGTATRDWYGAYHSVMAHMLDPEGDLAKVERPANPAAERPLDAYAGRYDNSYFGPAEIGNGPDGLVMTLGRRGQNFKLLPWDGDTFAIEPSGENAPKGSRSSVTFAASGEKVSGFTIDFYDANGLGSWSR